MHNTLKKYRIAWVMAAISVALTYANASSFQNDETRSTPAAKVVQPQPPGIRLVADGRNNSVTLAAATVVVSQSKQASKRDIFQQKIQPILSRYCVDCHGKEEPEGEISLATFTNTAAVKADANSWEKVYKVLKFNTMPPPDHDPKLSKQERQFLVDWIDVTLHQVDCKSNNDPGRVTLRRLNRREYNNTIRDLFGVEIDLAKDFPSDDIGNGFDNMGDVLSLPPLLMEKYFNAAEQVVEQVVVSQPQQSYKKRLTVSELRSSRNVRAREGWFALPSSGDVTGEFNFPQAGEYRVEVEAMADQAGNQPAKIGVSLNGRRFATISTTGSRKPAVYKQTIKVSRGKGRISAAFINDYYNPKARKRSERDRNLYIRSITLQGPLNSKPYDHLPAAHKKIVFTRPDKSTSWKQAGETVMRKFASRAYRRPVKDDELSRLLTLISAAKDRGETFEQGVQIAIQATLVSPHFLFRIETDKQPNNPQLKHALNDYELATRLSYFLWSSMPDAELFDLAKRKQLNQDHILAQQVRRMLKDDRSRALVDSFIAQWLNLEMLQEISPDGKVFQSFDGRLRDDMRRETELFAAHIIQSDKSILDFLDADYSFVNERLAKHYQIPNVRGDAFRKVQLPEQRRGILTQASILTLTSEATRTSVVKRGNWILMNILGADPPAPPATVPPLEKALAALPNATLKEQMALHSRDPACSVCHVVLDPLGFGLENYDAIGRWRTKVGKQTIDATGKLPDGKSFSGAIGLIEMLKQRDEEFLNCVTKKMMIFALGRDITPYDRCTIDEIVKTLPKQEHRFSVLVTAIASSKQFRMRRGEEKAVPPKTKK